MTKAKKPPQEKAIDNTNTESWKWYLDYEDYLQSDEWKELREQVMQRDNFRCRICGMGANQAHHHKYPKKGWFNDSCDNCIAICTTCHELVHGKHGALTNVTFADYNVTVSQHQVLISQHRGTNLINIPPSQMAHFIGSLVYVCSREVDPITADELLSKAEEQTMEMEKWGGKMQ